MKRKLLILFLILVSMGTATMVVLKYLRVQDHNNMEDEPEGGETMYEIKGVSYSPNREMIILHADKIKWIVDTAGEGSFSYEATKACVEDGFCKAEECVNVSCVNNGYYTRNKIPNVEALELDKDVKVNLIKFAEGKIEIVSAQQFAEILEKETYGYYQPNATPYRIKFEKEKVVEIEQVYVP